MLDNETNVYFVPVCKSDRSLTKWANVDMIQKLIDARKVVVAKLMHDAALSSQPQELMDADDAAPSAPKWAKHELYDDVASTCQLRVMCENDEEHRPRVLTSSSDRSKLWLELTTENIALLQLKPAEPTESWKPDLSEFPNVKWLKQRHVVQVTYWDSREQEKRMKSLPVKKSNPYDFADVQSRATRAARELQDVYNSNPFPS